MHFDRVSLVSYLVIMHKLLNLDQIPVVHTLKSNHSSLLDLLAPQSVQSSLVLVCPKPQFEEW